MASSQNIRQLPKYFKIAVKNFSRKFVHHLIDGLTSSMLLTLIIVPVAYLAVDTIKDRRAARKLKKREGKEEEGAIA